MDTIAACTSNCLDEDDLEELAAVVVSRTRSYSDGGEERYGALPCIIRNCARLIVRFVPCSS